MSDRSLALATSVDPLSLNTRVQSDSDAEDDAPVGDRFAENMSARKRAQLRARRKSMLQVPS